MKKYKILYRPLAVHDLNDVYLYIADTLKAPKAAGDLLDAIEASVNRMAAHPFSCRVFQHDPPLPEEFRLLPVKNYAVFYVVQEETIEIRRIVSAYRDLAKLL
jgi:plasmid stabilization system protein ParE